MSYIQIHKGAGLLIFGVALIVLCAMALSHIHSSSAVFGSCAQAKVAGYTNIPESSPAYNPALDRNKNGYACE